MDEDERIEKSAQERKTENLPDLPAAPQEAHDESGLVNRETSNVNEEAHQTSPHQRYQSY